jgi:hypothetical protein
MYLHHSSWQSIEVYSKNDSLNNLEQNYGVLDTHEIDALLNEIK